MKRLPFNVNAVDTGTRASARRHLRQTDRKSMIRLALSEKDTATNTLEKRLWAAADQLRAKTQTLCRTRDLLLPRLLSGQVNLKEN